MENSPEQISDSARRAAAEEIAREINGGDRADCTYPPALAALLDDCSIANEKALADWLESIISNYFADTPPVNRTVLDEIEAALLSINDGASRQEAVGKVFNIINAERANLNVAAKKETNVDA